MTAIGDYDAGHAGGRAAADCLLAGEDVLPPEEVTQRRPVGRQRWLVPTVAVAWSLFQLAVARWWILDRIVIRSVHLAFALFLLFCERPLWRRPRFGWSWPAVRDRIPFYDVVLAVLAVGAALYLVIDYEGLQLRPGMPLDRDVAVGLLLVLLLLEAARRAVGPALSLVALVFSLYVFCAPWLPQILASKGVSLGRYIGQITLSTEGIYGVPLGVSAAVVYLFVLFGAMLEQAGGGRFFIQLAISFLGPFRGGPAKAAVLGSGLTGMVSGSSIANIVTTGTFTIPMMKRVGYPAVKAAAIEVAASTDGQLAPPIMGAAAFIIAEYLGVSYLDVVKAAILPAAVSYMTLFYITHLEACKLGLRGIPRRELPRFLKVIREGAHFLLPVGVLLHQLIVQRRSPELSAFHAIWVMAAVMLLQHPIRAWRRKEPLLPAWRQGGMEVLRALVNGGRNMVSVALATAAAGIIVGVVSMGLGARVTEIIDIVSMGNIFLLLVITAITSLVIGMGLPTTATYIVMASLVAPAICQVAGQHHFVVPLMAAHLFCFYFGILADDTPPVGLAAYAASAIAKSPPVPTGVQAFLYDIRTAILPFMFIFNADLILHGIGRWDQGVLVFAMACLGNFAFAAATQRWLVVSMRLWEVPLFLAVTLVLMRPGLIADWIGLSHGQRYWCYLPGVALFAALYLWHRRRARRSTAREPAAGES